MYVRICLLLCSSQQKILLINHAVFWLGLPRETWVNVRVTNAAERARENTTVLFFLFLLIHFTAGSKHFPCIALIMTQGSRSALDGLS